MGESCSDHVSWSIRLERVAATRAFEQLVQLGRELVLQHFPPSRGYEATTVRHSGPLDGVGWRVTRGPFVAELGIQRFERAHTASDDRSMLELRLVASAGHRELDAPDPDALERRVVGWGMAGWGLGSVALGALFLGASGILAGWMQVLLYVPAVLAWRASVSGLVRRAARPPRALEGRSARALPAPQVQAQVEAGLERWQELLVVLRDQRARLERGGGLTPFRLAAPERAPTVRALAAGSSLIPKAEHASAASDRAGAPSRRTARRPGP
ncbi:MAG: hypothetical protein AB1Z98_21405 [Nannocystaceae bacterium]